MAKIVDLGKYKAGHQPRERDGRWAAFLRSPDGSLGPPGNMNLPRSRLGEHEEAVDKLNAALLDYIDCSMPESALFAEYVVNEDDEDNPYLDVAVVIDDSGNPMPPDTYAHISAALRELGSPLFNFDQQRVIDSDGEYGWERDLDYDPRLEASTKRGVEQARERLVCISQEMQDQALGEMWKFLPTDVEAVECGWTQEFRSLYFLGGKPDGLPYHPDDLRVVANAALEMCRERTIAPTEDTDREGVMLIRRPAPQTAELPAIVNLADRRS